MSEAAFRDLRRLAHWFSTSPARAAPQIACVVQRLGATAVPFLGRQLRAAEAVHREAARDALAVVAGQSAALRARVTAELQAITGGPASDEAKVVALGLLSELGEHGDAQFADPVAIRVRSAIALAAHLETAADVAGAADLMVHELATDDIVQMLEVMADAAPGAAQRLAGELVLRLDVAGDARDRIALVVPIAAAQPPDTSAAIASRTATAIGARSVESPVGATSDPIGVAGGSATGRSREPVHTAVLVDAAARRVVIATSKIAGARSWRRWAVLIDASGQIDDCLHEDDAGPDGDAASLIAPLCADGYEVISSEADDARQVVATAARRTAASTHSLPSPYYLGRDLLDLCDAHLGPSGHAEARSLALARAVELVAAGDHARALPLLERCDPDNADAAAALAASLLAQHQPAAALAALDRALAAEPDWPLHHWNRAAALHQLGDARGCHHALRRFVATSAIPSGLFADPDQPARVGCAERLIAEIERTARLIGKPLRRRAGRRASRTAPRTIKPTRDSASP